VLTTQLVDRKLRMAISPALEDGMPYAYAVRAGRQLREHWRAIEADLAMLDADNAHHSAIATDRPGRTAMLHMRTLQALDGTLAGASQRGVAEVLFGITAVAERWYDDSDLRAQVRRLIRRVRRSWVAATVTCYNPAAPHRDVSTLSQNVPAQHAWLSRDCFHPAAIASSAILTDGAPCHETRTVTAVSRTRYHPAACPDHAVCALPD